MDRDALRGSVGSRIAYLLTVENLSPSEWRTGRVLQQQHGMPVPPAVSPPGGKETVLLDIALPDTPGLYELFVDLVEEGVCYFSDRGSPPLVCEIEVVPGAPKPWRYQVL